MVDWVAITAAAPQLAGIVVMVVFVLKLAERQDSRDTKRDAVFIEALKSRDTEWRAWMQLDRERHAGGLVRVAEEIKSLAEVVGSVHSAVQQHDTWVRGELVRPGRRGTD